MTIRAQIPADPPVTATMTEPQILDVKFISDERAAVKAGCGDGVRWRICSREEGERIAAQLAAELRGPTEDVA